MWFIREIIHKLYAANRMLLFQIHCKKALSQNCTSLLEQNPNIHSISSSKSKPDYLNQLFWAELASAYWSNKCIRIHLLRSSISLWSVKRLFEDPEWTVQTPTSWLATGEGFWRLETDFCKASCGCDSGSCGIDAIELPNNKKRERERVV